METRANFILIGAFTLLAILGTLGFFVWLASVQINRQYSTYGILFEDVSGLDRSGDVLFNGIPVGKVIGLSISPQDPSKVFTSIEVEADTPIRADTVAQLQSQGVTGVAYISLSGGTPGAAPLIANEEGWQIIPSRRSTVQTIVEEAPDLLVEATALLEQFQVLTGPENQAYVSNILRNLDASSASLNQALSDFSEISGTVSEATAQITRFTDRLEVIAAAAESTLQQVDTTLAAAKDAFETADETIQQTQGAVANVEDTFAQAKLMLSDEVPEILSEISAAAANVNSAVVELQARAGETLEGFSQTSDLLNARLVELEKTVKEASTAFLAVTDASESFDTLVEGDGTLLVAEAREVLADAKNSIATIERVVLNDVPPIMSDIRKGVADASQAIERVASDITAASGRIDPIAEEAEQAFASAATLFEKSQGSLDALNRTLDVADGALRSAETAFESASAVLDTDLAPMMTDLRSASDKIAGAVTDVSEDIPVVTKELRALISRSDAVMKQIQATVENGAPGIRDFSNKGLPEISRLASETRTLVTTLGALVRRIERNPTRFLLEDRVPEYRR